MAVKSQHLTPHVLVTTPRRCDGSPHSDASAILFSVNTYSLESNSNTERFHILDAATGESSLVTDVDGIREASWIDDDTIVTFRAGKDGAVEVGIGNANDFDKSSYTAGTINGPAEGIRLCRLGDDDYLLAFTARAKPDGSIFNPETKEKSPTTGLLYNTLFVNHWDEWISKDKLSIWTGKLTRKAGEDKYTLSSLSNALHGTGLESPIPPFGGKDHFDISTTGLVFVAKDPALNPATHTKCNVYFIPFKDGDQPASCPILQLPVPGFEGAASCPVFSADGSQIAFLKMRQDGYEADKNQLFVVPKVSEPTKIVQYLASTDGRGRWDRSPQSIAWGHDPSNVFLVAEEEGQVALFSLAISVPQSTELPKRLSLDGSVSDVRPLASGVVFVSGSSLIDNSWYRLVDPNKPAVSKLISSNTDNGAALGLSGRQLHSIQFQGAKSTVQAWVIKPSTFDENKKYPLAYLIHGGPQGAWNNKWGTRWNPAVFAEQGFVVVAPNPTGSTGFGQAFTDAIQYNWGSLPYEDIANGFRYIEEKLPYVDTTKAVALGASYGGYMMNWIQGQPLGKKFKAIVCHDGIFSMAGMLSTEELYFPEHEFGGPFWEHRQEWLKHNPSDYVEKCEGLATFNVLQTRGIESQLLVFPDENHWVQKQANSLYWYTVVLNWICRHVGLAQYGEEDAISLLPGNEHYQREIVRL